MGLPHEANIHKDAYAAKSPRDKRHENVSAESDQREFFTHQVWFIFQCPRVSAIQGLATKAFLDTLMPI